MEKQGIKIGILSIATGLLLALFYIVMFTTIIPFTTETQVNIFAIINSITCAFSFTLALVILIKAKKIIIKIIAIMLALITLFMAFMYIVMLTDPASIIKIFT